MRKIYLYTFIIALLALFTFASGCTSNNQTSNQTSAGNYSVNGLYFNYPLDWIISTQTRGNLQVIRIYDLDLYQSNGTKGNLITIETFPKTSNVTYQTTKNGMQNETNITLDSKDETVNITGLTANVTIFTGTDSGGNKTQVKLIYFDKNNYTYILKHYIMGSIDIQQQQKYFDTIITSFKAP
jgi:hypothetical protein